MRRAMLATALVAAALLAGCGETNTALIPEQRSADLLASVDEVQSACSTGDTQAAQDALDDLSARVNELPRNVDRQLKRNLRQWVEQLQRRLENDCQPEETPTPEPTETATPEPTETATPEPTETAPPTETPDTGGVPGPDEDGQ